MESAIAKLREFTACALELGRTPGEQWEIFWRLTKNFRVRLSLARYHPDLVYQLATRYGVVSLRDNFGDVTNLPGLLFRNEYRLGRLNQPGLILDVGANIGLFAAWAAAQNPGRKIFCFEPLASNARLIQLNCPTAVVKRIGLGRARATVKMRVDGQGVMASSVATPWPTREEEFEVVPLDEYARENAIEQVAFLKIDTEGMELDVLDGARETLGRTHRVALETHGRENHQRSIERLRQAGLGLDAEEYSQQSNTGLVFACRAAQGRA